MKQILFILIVAMISWIVPGICKSNICDPLISGSETRLRQLEKPVVIVGSGVGALTAAVYLQRAGIPTLVLEGPEPGGAIAQSPSVENWPGELQINGQDLIDKIRNQAESNGAKITAKEVIAVDFQSAPYRLIARDVYDYECIETIEAKAVILSMGSQPKLLGVPGESGEKGYWTRGVYSCATCDGPLYRDKVVAVIGGGDKAILEADFLAKIAKKVYVIIRSDTFRTVEATRLSILKNQSNVEVLYNTKVAQIQGDGKKVTHLNLSTKRDLSVDGVFVAIGATPNSAILQGAIDLDREGYVKLINGQQTSAPGVFAIGDMVDPYYKQAISAAGDGAKAAIEVEHFLSSLPLDHPLSQEVKALKMAHSPEVGVKELVNEDDFYQAIGPQETPLVVDFYSPYCNPCKKFASEFNEAAQNYGDKARFLKVDVTQFSTLAEKYGVFSLPTVMIFDKNGKIVAKGSGLKGVHKAIKKLDRILE